MTHDRKARLNRRTFLRAAAIGIGSAALAACGGGGATAPTQPPATLPPPTTAPTLAPVQPTPPSTAAPAPTAAPAGAVTNSLGVTLPENAAPLEHQTFVVYFDITADFTSPNQMETIYKSGGFGSITNLTGDTLVRLNKDFQVQPAAALSWSSDETGKVWTFNLVHLQETFSDVVKTDKTGLSKTAHTRWMISAFANFLPGSTIFRLA